METIGKHKEFESAAKALHHDWTPEKVHHLIDVVDKFVASSLAQRAASQPTPVRTYDWSREGMELADGQSGAYVRHFDFVMKNASQDTVPTTVANQAINDALRLVSKDGERDAALREVHAFLLGEAPLCGLWFGVKPEFKDPFWWRSHLRAAMAAQQSDKR